MDGFRIREVREVLTLDDLKERVDTVDLLFSTIEVSSGQGRCICSTNLDCCARISVVKRRTLMWRRHCCKLMSLPFRCWPKSLRRWNQLKNYGRHRTNSKRIISFGKQCQLTKKKQNCLQLFCTTRAEGWRSLRLSTSLSSFIVGHLSQMTKYLKLKCQPGGQPDRQD